MERIDDDIQMQYLKDWNIRRNERKLEQKFYIDEIRIDFKILLRHIKSLLKSL